MVTLVERHSRYLLVLPLLDATTSTVVAAVTAAFQRLRPTMRRSLTWDRAVDMTQHADFTAATGIPVYFCDAYCRGSTAATRTATDCCGNTSRRKPTYPNTTQITSTPRSTAQRPTSTEPGMASSS